MTQEDMNNKVEIASKAIEAIISVNSNQPTQQSQMKPNQMNKFLNPLEQFIQKKMEHEEEMDRIFALNEKDGKNRSLPNEPMFVYDDFKHGYLNNVGQWVQYSRAEWLKIEALRRQAVEAKQHLEDEERRRFGPGNYSTLRP